MKRAFWGLVMIALGVLVLLQETGEFYFGLSPWPVIATLIGLALTISSFRRLPPSVIKLVLGLWLGAIGVFTMLENAGLVQISGSYIAKLGWPVLLIAIGIKILTGFSGFGSFRWNGSNKPRWGLAGDLRYGRSPWVLDGDFRVDHGVGDVKIDFTTARIADGVHVVEVDAKIGEVLIVVPDNVNVTADASLGVGDLRVFEERHSGVGSLTLKGQIKNPESPVDILVRARLGIGKLQVLSGPAQTKGINQ